MTTILTKKSSIAIAVCLMLMCVVFLIARGCSECDCSKDRALCVAVPEVRVDNSVGGDSDLGRGGQKVLLQNGAKAEVLRTERAGAANLQSADAKAGTTYTVLCTDAQGNVAWRRDLAWSNAPLLLHLEHIECADILLVSGRYTQHALGGILTLLPGDVNSVTYEYSSGWGMCLSDQFEASLNAFTVELLASDGAVVSSSSSLWSQRNTESGALLIWSSVSRFLLHDDVRKCTLPPLKDVLQSNPSSDFILELDREGLPCRKLIVGGEQELSTIENVFPLRDGGLLFTGLFLRTLTINGTTVVDLSRDVYYHYVVAVSRSGELRWKRYIGPVTFSSDMTSESGLRKDDSLALAIQKYGEARILDDNGSLVRTACAKGLLGTVISKEGDILWSGTLGENPVIPLRLVPLSTDLLYVTGRAEYGWILDGCDAKKVPNGIYYALFRMPQSGFQNAK